MKNPLLSIIYAIIGIFIFAGYFIACSMFPKFAFWCAVIFGGTFLVCVAWKSLNMDEVEINETDEV